MNNFILENCVLSSMEQEYVDYILNRIVLNTGEIFKSRYEMVDFLLTENNELFNRPKKVYKLLDDFNTTHNLILDDIIKRNNYKMKKTLMARPRWN